MERREICKLWRDQITGVFNQEIKTVCIFDSRENNREFELFIEQTDKAYMKDFTDSILHPSTSVTLLCSDAALLPNNGLLKHFTGSQNLVYFGSEPLEKWKENAFSVAQQFAGLAAPVNIIINRFVIDGKISLNDYLDAFLKFKSVYLLHPKKQDVYKLFQPHLQFQNIPTIRLNENDTAEQMDTDEVMSKSLVRISKLERNE